MTSETAVAVTEVRVLEGPNLYFAKPAIKVSLEVPGYLKADERTLLGLARRVGLRTARPGAPGTEQRQRFVMRLVERAVRSLAQASGTSRLGVRVRPGSPTDAVVAAFVWRRRNRGRALGHGIGPVLQAWLDGADVVAEQGLLISQSEPGERPSILKPTIPVASVTGTNGKTTTTRLLGHIGMTAGLRTAWSSTDGVVVQGETVEEGDYSGPAGARGVLTAPGVQLGILETARGGMLLKGMGVSANDVSVVTNVSADHLGLQGIDTVDQLAEVKAIVTKATKPSGWVVLNGEDPRVWAMRSGIKAKPWVFTLRADAPAVRESLDQGGRAITVLDGDIAVLENGQDPDRLVSILDVPATLSGLSHHNIANALAGAAAALGLGLPRAAVVEGLRTFAPDDRLNPGRMNTYTLRRADGAAITVIVDLAHNEAGLEALMDVAHGLKAPGGQVHLGLGLAGDRTDELLESMGEVAGLRADRVVAAHKAHYLRGRTMEELESHLLVGLARAGVADIDSFDTELGGLQALVPGAADGDVVALMCHSERVQVASWLAEQGATTDSPADIRRKVVAARGEHEFEDRIAELWALADDGARIDAAARLRAQRPGDPRLVFEVASAFDAAGREQEAIPLYREALAAGLREPHRHRARIQLASSLRVTGQPELAYSLLTELAAERPGSAAVQAFRALAGVDSGRAAEAVADLVDALLHHAGDDDALAYRHALHGYAAELRAR
ncbi:tetratricopeptide repeat protein [Nostocoides sp. HKS02]|uniref:tetratricopeptide repeat protein n=1 Tax=Nostocoides sp. HKS02 TaxID=1813880 RepID=UPI0012B493DD|nr:tetratricopeptide repeat protein [Tetrasphaera sp. HKS02]QGN57218.1 tetratricopeptide repeat protein [Tetrasphaera sp. HKS02]